MATTPSSRLKAEYSNGIKDKLARYDPNKAEPEVVFQSVAPGTTIRRGETVSVRLVSTSDVPLKDLVAENLPDRFAKVTLFDLDEVAENDELIEILKDPEQRKDPVKRSTAKAALEKSLKGTLNEQETELMFDLVASLF